MTRSPTSRTLSEALELTRALGTQAEEVGRRLGEREAVRQQIKARLDALGETESARGGLPGATRRGGGRQTEFRETLRLLNEANHEIQVLIRERKSLHLKAHAAAEQVNQARLSLIEAEREAIRAMPERTLLVERLRLIRACYKRLLRKARRQPPAHWLEGLLTARPTQGDLAAAAALLQIEDS